MEEAPVTQQTDEWLEARRGRLTGTRIARLVKARPATVAKMLDTIRRENEEGPGGWLEDRDSGGGAATQWGKENEPRAIALAEMVLDLETEPAGVVYHPADSRNACSPDGFVIEDILRTHVLEVKCPYNGDNHEWTRVYGMAAEHRIQTQVEIWCTGLPLLFLSFDPRREPDKQLYHEYVEKDQETQELIERKTAWFWDLYDRGEYPDMDPLETPKFF